jgi:hypothetical protein
MNTANQVWIIIPDLDDEQDNSKKPSPSKASGSSKRKVHFLTILLHWPQLL